VVWKGVNFWKGQKDAKSGWTVAIGKRTGLLKKALTVDGIVEERGSDKNLVAQRGEKDLGSSNRKKRYEA